MNRSSNITGITELTSNSEWIYSPVQWTWPNITQFIMAITGIIGNGLVICVYANNRKMRSTTNGLLVGLAIADLITSILLVPVPTWTTVPSDWRGDLYCKLIYSSVLMWILIVVSVFTLTMVSVERYLAISYPLKYRMVFSKSRPKVITILIWILAICINTFSFFITFNKEGACTVIWPSSTFQAVFGTALFLIEYFIPMIIMIVTHVGTIIGLRNHARELIERNETPGSPAYVLLKARRKVIEMLLIVVITFVICWSPDQFAFLAFNLGFVPVRYLYGTLYQVFVLMAFCNSCCNPIIYAFKNDRFRMALKNIVTWNIRDVLGHSSAATNGTDMSTVAKEACNIKMAGNVAGINKDGGGTSALQNGKSAEYQQTINSDRKGNRNI